MKAKTLLQHAATMGIGIWLGYMLLDNLAPNEPLRQTNLAIYHVEYERCMKLINTESKCAERAEKKSLVCVGCE